MTTETKYFTPEEAQRTLPLVKQIVKDILDTTREMRLIADEVGTGAEDDPRIRRMVGDVDKFMKELEEIGCYFKDWNFTIGLVDFPSVIDGEEVFLCWRSDEESIRYFHGLDEGVKGRKPIPEGYLSE